MAEMSLGKALLLSKKFGSGGNSGGGEGEETIDMLQQLVNTNKSIDRLFNSYKGDSLDFIKKLDTSQATSASSAFYGIENIDTIPLLDFSNIENFSETFANSKFKSLPALNFSKGKSFDRCFTQCEIEDYSHLDFSNAEGNFQYVFYNSGTYPKKFPNFNLPKVTNLSNCFGNIFNISELTINAPLAKYLNSMCNGSKFVSINLNNVENVTNFNNFVSYCKMLENLTMQNIKANLQVGSGTSWGHLLTADSLVGLCKECINYNSSTMRTLTVGTANLEKLANVYVKFTDATQTTIATGEKGEVEVCESTDTGAMLIEDYMALKYWSLA